MIPLLTEDEILEGHDDPGPPDSPMHDNNQALEDQDTVVHVHGVEDAGLDVNGFATDLLQGTRHSNSLRDMFRVSQSKKFEAVGGTNQHIALNAFTIRKTVDVKRLKHQLWETMQPKLNTFAQIVSKQRGKEVEMTDENQNESQTRNRQVSTKETDKLDEMTMSSLMQDLYFGRKIVNANNVSVQSAFICLLHLANEKELEFEQEDKNGGGVLDARPLSEADFKISLAQTEEEARGKK